MYVYGLTPVRLLHALPAETWDGEFHPCRSFAPLLLRPVSRTTHGLLQYCQLLLQPRSTRAIVSDEEEEAEDAAGRDRQ